MLFLTNQYPTFLEAARPIPASVAYFLHQRVAQTSAVLSFECMSAIALNAICSREPLKFR